MVEPEAEDRWATHPQDLLVLTPRNPIRASSRIPKSSGSGRSALVKEEKAEPPVSREEGGFSMHYSSFVAFKRLQRRKCCIERRKFAGASGVVFSPVTANE